MLDSIRLRLALWHVGALAILLVGFCTGLYAVLYRRHFNRVDVLAEKVLDVTATRLAEELSKSDLSKPDLSKSDLSKPELSKPELSKSRLSKAGAVDQAPRDALEGLSFADATVAIYDLQGVLVAEKPAGASRSAPLPAGVTLREGAIRFTTKRAREGGQPSERRVAALRVSFPLVGRTYLLAAGMSLDQVRMELSEVREVFYVDVPIALLLTGLTGWFLTHKTLAPVVAMAEQARRIGAASLQERIVVLNPRDELGRVAAAFNELLDRLGAALSQQRQFMADASHELRTPVSVIRTATEVTLSRRQRSEEEYRTVLLTIDGQGRQLSRLVEDMLRLARADSGSLNLRCRKFHLEELLSEVVADARVLGASKGLQVDMAELPEAPFEGDEDLLRQMILNLVDNSVKFTPAKGVIRLDLEPGGGEYSIIVSDTGPGIPKLAQARVFERFYRVDPSHSRDGQNCSGGAGLGLSIARWIAEAHHGRLELRQSDERGSVFVAVLPMPAPLPGGPRS